jgi:hypothetical protein
MQDLNRCEGFCYRVLWNAITFTTLSRPGLSRRDEKGRDLIIGSLSLILLELYAARTLRFSPATFTRTSFSSCPLTCDYRSRRSNATVGNVRQIVLIALRRRSCDAEYVAAATVSCTMKAQLRPCVTVCVQISLVFVPIA